MSTTIVHVFAGALEAELYARRSSLAREAQRVLYDRERDQTHCLIWLTGKWLRSLAGTRVSRVEFHVPREVVPLELFEELQHRVRAVGNTTEPGAVDRAEDKT